MEDQPKLTLDLLIDEFEDYRHTHTTAQVIMMDPVIEKAVIIDLTSLFQLYSQKIKPREFAYESYLAKFAWLLIDIIKKTLEATTQYYRTPMGTYFKKKYKFFFQHAMFIKEMSLLEQILCTLTLLPLAVE